MTIEDRLQELGIILPHPAKPAGSYKPCVMVDNIAYISGQGPLLAVSYTHLTLPTIYSV